MPLDPGAVAAHETARDKVGIDVTFQRISGQAPNVFIFSAAVVAVVRQIAPNTTEPSRAGYSASQIGSLTQGDRRVIVLAADLAAARFPLPLQKRDKILVASTGETFDITEVDPYKRAMAGAIELVATGMA